MRGNETAKLKNKEYDRWARAVAKTSEDLAKVDEVIHVMDAEADSYALLAAMAEAENQFVVRLCHDRCARSVSDDDWSHVRELLDGARPFKRQRAIHVSKRSARRAPDAKKAHPARDSRTAHLTFSFTTVVIKRPDYLKDMAKEIRLNVVRVFEKSPPEGVKPIEWVLLTNEPVKTKASAERIVDIYCQKLVDRGVFQGDQNRVCIPQARAHQSILHL